MGEDIESLLNEAVNEYKNRLKDFDRKHFLFDWISAAEENDTNLIVTRQLKEAYSKKDIKAFDKIPLGCDGLSGVGGWNTISFSFSLTLDYERRRLYIPTPFGNETAGSMSYLYISLIDSLERECKPTKFYKKLKRADEELLKLRNKITEEIVFSDNYQKAIEKVSSLPENMSKVEFEKRACEILRDAYREEEFKRAVPIIEICNKTEELILLTYSLFKRLRAYI